MESILPFLFLALLVFLVSLFVRINAKLNSLEESKESETPTTLEESSEPTKLAHVVRYDNATRDIWSKTNSAGEVEKYVTQQLLSLGENYFIFQNVILPSAYKKMLYTEIDHIIISQFGIFCIETKSHVGSIYGNKDAQDWKQYLYGDQSYDLYNPLKQSYSHTEALKNFLGSNLRSSIHYYVVFPKARVVKVNSTLVSGDIHEIIDRIARHQTVMYDINDLERILKSLAHYDSKHAELEDRHIKAVRDYMNIKLTNTQK